MKLDKQIEQLIEDGCISSAEAQDLQAVMQISQEEDQKLYASIRNRRSRRRVVGRLISLAVVFLVLIGVGIVCAVYTAQGSTQVVDQYNFVEADSISPEELDRRIVVLEQELRRPGSENDYARLAMAYQQRFEQSGSEQDLLRAEEASTKARRLYSKNHKEVIMGKMSLVFVLLFVVIVLAGIGLTVMVPYNWLARSDELVDARWSQVETVMQRRLDLIPNLVETVKGYAEHEQDTLLQVTKARTAMVEALKRNEVAPTAAAEIKAFAQAERGLSSALSGMLALAEKYPDIKASANYLSLQDQLEGTENRITVERQRYNDAVRRHNSSVRTFPSNVVAALFSFENRAYFDSVLGAEKAVAVNMGDQ